MPLGFSISKAINILLKSVGLAPELPLPPGVSHTALLLLLGISFSELGGFSLLFTCTGVTSSVFTWFLTIFPDPSGDARVPDCLGGEDRGEAERPAFREAVEAPADLMVDLGGPPTAIVAKKLN